MSVSLRSNSQRTPVPDVSETGNPAQIGPAGRVAGARGLTQDIRREIPGAGVGVGAGAHRAATGSGWPDASPAATTYAGDRRRITW